VSPCRKTCNYSCSCYCLCLIAIDNSTHSRVVYVTLRTRYLYVITVVISSLSSLSSDIPIG
jgi:hypothetical protein